MREGLAAWSGSVFRNLPQDPLGATEGPDPQPHPSLAMSWLVPWASALTSLGCPPLQGEDRRRKYLHQTGPCTHSALHASLVHE